MTDETHRWPIGTRLRKISGTWWCGKVVGHYSTEKNIEGYAVQLDMVSNGPVQIYPASALEIAPPLEMETSLTLEELRDKNTRLKGAIGQCIMIANKLSWEKKTRQISKEIHEAIRPVIQELDHD